MKKGSTRNICILEIKGLVDEYTYYMERERSIDPICQQRDRKWRHHQNGCQLCVTIGYGFSRERDCQRPIELRHMTLLSFGLWTSWLSAMLSRETRAFVYNNFDEALLSIKSRFFSTKRPVKSKEDYECNTRVLDPNTQLVAFAAENHLFRLSDWGIQLLSSAAASSQWGDKTIRRCTPWPTVRPSERPFSAMLAGRRFSECHNAKCLDKLCCLRFWPRMGYLIGVFVTI
jgi:hypothetical protein